MRVAVCCKQDLLLNAVASLLSHEGGFYVVAKSSDLEACIRAASLEGAHTLIVYSEGLDERDLVFLSGARAYGNLRVVLLLADGENEIDSEVFDLQIAFGSETETLFNSIRELRSEEGYGRRASEDKRTELTEREQEVAQLVAKGFSNRRIADLTGLQEQSVKNLVSVIMRKLGCDNRVQVALRLVARIAE